MDERVLKVKELFADVLPGFGTLHAGVFVALSGGEIKTARQLSEETGISHNKVYAVLKDLVREKTVMLTNTNPASFYMSDASSTYQKLVEKQMGVLKKRVGQFDKIMAVGSTGEEGREYLIKITNSQAKLFDFKNKALVKEAKEAEQVIRSLNIYAEKLDAKKEYAMAVYR